MLFDEILVTNEKSMAEVCAKIKKKVALTSRRVWLSLSPTRQGYSSYAYDVTLERLVEVDDDFGGIPRWFVTTFGNEKEALRFAAAIAIFAEFPPPSPKARNPYALSPPEAP